jgi:aspartate/methionine/tyrosine aminotransferase
MDVLEKAQELEKAGKSVIHLEIGQPDFTTPECIMDAAAKAMRDGHTGYTHSMGILPLREALASYYAREYGVKVSPERIIVTNGTSAAMLLLFAALFDRGGGAVMSDPRYACYANFVLHAGGNVISVPTLEEDGFQVNVEDVRARLTPDARAILVNSPSNPGGTIIAPEKLKALCGMGPMIVSDEIYHGLVYEGRAASVLEFSDEACALDGFSKRYAMTGWRLGWMVIPENLVRTVRKLQQNFMICANSMAQWGGIAALEEAGPDVERMRQEYARRRKVLLAGLRSLGLTVKSDPVGAFYVLANARHLGDASLALAFDILEKAGVGVAPGIDFGPGAEGYLRFSYANSVENIEEAMHRLGKYLENR